LLILDEPFNGLDPIGRFDMIKLLKNWSSQRKSVILASHILHEVEAINPSFLLISGGRLLASGSTQQVRSMLADTPNTLRIHSSDSKKLANLLIEHCPIESLRFVQETRKDGVQALEFSTRSAAEVYSKLPSLTADHQIAIYEMHSADESLKHLFSTLMQIHRGESTGSRKRQEVPK
jgi:ABC-2 type transport system ATP-binding protein